MPEIAIPSLYCPFASRISPHADALEAANLAWLDMLELVPGGGARVVQRARFGRLAARAYPDASLDMLGIAAAWATWLFLRDDRCDEGGIASDPQAMRALADLQIDILAGQRPEARGDDPLNIALADLRERMLARGGGRWMARFVANVQDYFDANVWEAENRARGRVPDVDAYVRLRDLTGAVKTCFDIFELVESPLAIDVRYHPRLAHLMCLANRAICWSNDLFSIEKELEHGDVHNLVLVLQHGSSLSVDDAVTCAAAMHDGAIRAFERHEQQIFSVATPETHRFVAALKGWIRANVDWSIETGRYARREHAVVAEATGAFASG